VTASLPNGYRSVVVERLSPELQGGRDPVKRVLGDELVVEADALREGHDQLAVWLLVREPGAADWRRLEMRPLGNDRWGASFRLERLGRYHYTVEAAPDRYGSWLADLGKRVAANQDLASELIEGQRLLRDVAVRAAGTDQEALLAAADRLDPLNVASALSAARDSELVALTLRYTDPALLSRYDRELELVVERERAAFGAWYEIFVRSQGTDPHRSATFREAERRLPAIEAMGFDVLYLTPIHPIGLVNRKGPNNSLVAGPNDPGSPYAIGAAAGGHTAIEPALGTLDDFAHFLRAAHERGLELALDLAVQVSPDHPWVVEHPEWFYHRPDGSIRYAENPPKKYEDIYPLNFDCADWRGLWQALRDVVLFWARRGVRIFRVDNPHTKPLDFWRWLIVTVQAELPDTIFLSEAFTRPKMMQALARAGFSQSYTYFTWRNTKDELTSYLREITTPPVSDYFRGNLFANTPDILPGLLQVGGPPAFKLRLVLAATASSLYGIYNGFELCEGRAHPDSELYVDSEMYQHKVWDWDRPGNIVDLVSQVNQVRRENRALHRSDNLRFLRVDNEHLLCYVKQTSDRSNTILVVLNLDPFQAHAGLLHLPFEALGFDPDRPARVEDLLSGRTTFWRGPTRLLDLNPVESPVRLLRLTGTPLRPGPVPAGPGSEPSGLGNLLLGAGS
jgi:starch synthase (maltosyl-transferring)